MSRHESPECGAMIGRMLSALIVRASEGDTEAIEQLAAVETLAGQALTAGLAVAREAGYSNAELAAVVGTSRQNVSQRIGRAVRPACAHLVCLGRRTCRTSGAKL